MTVPSWLKWGLVPAWNAGHRLGWWVSEHFDALTHGRYERCACCGRVSPMLRRRRSIPPRLVALWGLSPRAAEALVRKETLLCARCGAKLRARRLARVVMETFPTSGTPPRSLREWAGRPEARALSVAEINLIEGVHEAICGLPGLRFSDYVDDPLECGGLPPLSRAERRTKAVASHRTPKGNRAHRHPPSEDLTRLSYEDAAFDLILTSETLEHVPDLYTALSEIRRVLKPGGWHLFTVPMRPGVAKTFARTEIQSDGGLLHHAPPIAHPGGDWGYPVFTEFGADLPEILDRAGFDTTVHFGPISEDDLAQVFASRRR